MKIEFGLSYHWQLQHVYRDGEYLAALVFDVKTGVWSAMSMHDEYSADELIAIAGQLDVLNESTGGG